MRAYVGDNIEHQTIHFAVPMNSRTSKEARSKIQQIYLQLRQHGLPLVRIHSDRGLELKTKETTASWQRRGRANSPSRTDVLKL